MLTRSWLPAIVPIAIAGALLAGPSQAAAQQAEWRWNARALMVVPQDNCEPIADLGTVLTLSTGGGLALDLSYGLTSFLAVELSIATTHHTLHTSRGLWGGRDAGTVWFAPVTLSLQYSPPLIGDLHPYVGAGVGYGQLFGLQVDEEVESLGVRDIELDGGAGLALRAGVIYDLDQRSFVRLDLTRLTLRNQATLVNQDSDSYASVDLDVNPWLVGLGIGYHF